MVPTLAHGALHNDGTRQVPDQREEIGPTGNGELLHESISVRHGFFLPDPGDKTKKKKEEKSCGVFLAQRIFSHLGHLGRTYSSVAWLSNLISPCF